MKNFLQIGLCLLVSVVTVGGITNDEFTVRDVEIMDQAPLLPSRSELAQQIIDQLQIAPDFLKIDDLPKADVAPTIEEGFELVKLDPPENVRDGFTHVIVIDPATRRFWVIRSGGFAGVRDIRGPVVFTNEAVNAVSGE